MWICRLMLLLLPAINGYLLTHPENQVTFVGRRVTFHCQTNATTKTIHWTHTPVNRQLATDIPRNSGRHSVNSTASGNRYFTILSVTLPDAGIYAWSDEDGYGEPYGVDLVVMPTSPSCETNVSLDGVVAGDIVGHTCRFAFSGNLEPVARWVARNGEEAAICRNESNGERVCRKITRASNSSDVLLSNTFVLDFRANSNPGRKISVNNLTSVFSWTSPEVEFLFPVSHVRVNVTPAAAAAAAAQVVVMYLGQSIRCSSRGRPSAKFTWQRTSNFTFGFAENVSSVSILKLTEVGQHRYRCCAENVIRGNLNAAFSETIIVDVRSVKLPSIESPRIWNNASFNVSGGNFDIASQTNLSSKPNHAADIDSLVTSSVVLGSSRVDGNVTERVTPLYETTLFVTTLAFGFILLAALVLCIARVIYRKTKNKNKAPPISKTVLPEGYYLTLTDDSSTQYPLRKASTSDRPVYVNESLEDVYEEIDETQVTDDLEDDMRYKKHLQREPMQGSVDDGMSKQPCLFGTKFEFSKGDKISEFIGFESNYITCPGVLKTTNCE